MTRRSTISRFGALGGSALLVAAIGAPVAAQDVQTEGWGEVGDVTLRVNGESSSQGSLTTLAEMFMEEYPNVTIELDFKSWDPYIATMINVADLPDAPDILFGNQGYVHDGTLVEAGLIASLEPYYEAYGWDEWHGEGAMDQWRFTEDGTFGEGPRWGISESADFVGVFYNKQKLADLGLEVPTTMDEFEAAVVAAADAGELPIKLGNLDGWPAMHTASIAQGATVDAENIRAWVFGKEGADYASEAHLAGYTKFKEWVDNGWVSEDANGLGYDDAWQQFADGDGVFLPAGSWLTAGLYERMGDNVGFFAPPPGESGKVVATAANSMPFHISSKSENPDLAAGFINFVMHPDKGQVYYDNGRIPASAGSVGEPADPLTADTVAAWNRIAEDDGLIFFQDWASDTMYDTMTAGLQELIGDRISAEEFVTEVQDDWATFHANR
ncbi:MAG: extracellular solute-binding protein [Candidatus Limnocylindrales bacterium]